ncbi:MAG TPA: YbaB/EbfC family nucleoid-associated protein [Thermotogota bacterium]|nr:YbaB/EbfC family nucleoid-associated protein [Thermotogota bacterium]HRW93060.1 YbaB/EbfC family nucleoid-associated protein [Thermotogota bacterium]
MAKKMRSFGGKSFRNPATKKPGMDQLLRQAELAQQKMDAFEEEFATRQFEASAGGGAIKIQIQGDFRILDLEYDNDLLEEPDDFKDLLTAALNQAIETVKTTKDQEMEQITGGMGLPDLGI